MNDEIIVDWYLQKNQKAITESAAQYGTKLKRISFNIVQNMSDAEECENDTYLSAWNSIPPHSPKQYLFSFLAKIIRNLTIAAYYGLRRSEVLGLRWSAIDFENKTISINHKVIEVKQDGKFVPIGEDTLKTKSSHRTLPLLPVVEQKLLEQRERQQTYQRLFKKAYCTDYLEYICTDELGRLHRPNYVTEHFGWLIKKYELKVIRFHDLRHTCASLLLAAGVPMKQIQIWLGHSTFATTADIYAHLDYHAQTQTGNVMGSMYEK